MHMILFFSIIIIRLKAVNVVKIRRPQSSFVLWELLRTDTSPPFAALASSHYARTGFIKDRFGYYNREIAADNKSIYKTIRCTSRH
jgi:hypothetical protein